MEILEERLFNLFSELEKDDQERVESLDEDEPPVELLDKPIKLKNVDLYIPPLKEILSRLPQKKSIGKKYATVETFLKEQCPNYIYLLENQPIIEGHILKGKIPSFEFSDPRLQNETALGKKITSLLQFSTWYDIFKNPNLMAMQKQYMKEFCIRVYYPLNDRGKMSNERMFLSIKF